MEKRRNEGKKRRLLFYPQMTQMTQMTQIFLG